MSKLLDAYYKSVNPGPNLIPGLERLALNVDKTSKRLAGNDNAPSYNNLDPAPELISDLERLSHHALLFENREFFSGACMTCGSIATVIHLHRCAGCQLVSYCNKKCQKEDWKQHKTFCKIFPVENGENVIVRKTKSDGKDFYKWMAVIEELQLTAYMAVSFVDPHDGQIKVTYGVENIFIFARVCSKCHEARPEKLIDCRCCAVSYCMKHSKQEDHHFLDNCDQLYICAMANWYLRQHHRLHIPDGLLSKANLISCLQFEKISKMPQYACEKWLETIVFLVNERLALPLTILHALNKLKIGEHGKTLTEITSLTIHIVYSFPMLDPRIWEFFLHQLPNVKTLNLAFLSGNMRLYNKFNSFLPLERCTDCKKKQRIINYNIEMRHYHEYFSSDNYVEPDVVAVFGIDHELLHAMGNIDKAHTFASITNITYKKHTIAILTDMQKDRLEKCIKSFNKCRPVKVLLPIKKNPVCGFSIFRIPNLNLVFNNTDLVCCIQGKK